MRTLVKSGMLALLLNATANAHPSGIFRVNQNVTRKETVRKPDFLEKVKRRTAQKKREFQNVTKEFDKKRNLQEVPPPVDEPTTEDNAADMLVDGDTMTESQEDMMQGMTVDEDIVDEDDPITISGQTGTSTLSVMQGLYNVTFP